LSQKESQRDAGFFIVCDAQASLLVVLAVAVGAVAIQIEAVIGQPNIVMLGDVTLTLFYHFIGEFDHLATVKANQVVMVLLGRQLKHGLAAFKVVTGDDACIIKLVQNAIHGRQTNLFTMIDQSFVEVFGTGVLAFRLLQDLEDLDTRQCDLEPGLF
jgi:hypothetical protein